MTSGKPDVIFFMISYLEDLYTNLFILPYKKGYRKHLYPYY